MSVAAEQQTTETNGEAKDRFTADFENLKNNFTQLRTDLTHLMNSAMGVGKSGATIVSGQAVNAATTAVDGVKHRISDLKEKGSESAEALEQTLSDHPLATTLIAFGAGFVIARLLSRK